MEVTVVMLDNGMNLYVDMPIAGVAKEFDSQLFKHCLIRFRTLNLGEAYVEPSKVIGLRRGEYMPSEEGTHDSD